MSDQLFQTILTVAISTVSGGGLVAGFAALRKERRDGETHGVDLFQKLLADVATVQNRQTETWNQLQVALQQAALAKTEVTWLRGIVTSFVRPVVEWIDAGAQPPPPTVSDEGRRVRAAAENPALPPPTTTPPPTSPPQEAP